MLARWEGSLAFSLSLSHVSLHSSTVGVYQLVVFTDRTGSTTNLNAQFPLMIFPSNKLGTIVVNGL